MTALPFNIPGFNPKVTPPTVKFPAGATDCHAHVFGPQSQFPYLPGAAYIPPDATPHDFARMLTSIGCRRAVLVQPSVYGPDNSCMVAALKSGVFNFRGIAVVEPNPSDKELQTLHDSGVRGIRIVWGSDWPHPAARSNMPDDGDLANQFGEWVTDEGMRTRILVDNPARLYGF